MSNSTILSIVVFIFVGWLFSYTGEWRVLWFLALLFFIKDD